MSRPIKPITKREQRFAKYLAEGFSAVEAGRKAYGWKCERFTPEEKQAKTLASSARIKAEVVRLKEEDNEEAVLTGMVESSSPSDWEGLHQYAFRRLKTIRDNARNPARVRYEALLALEKLEDPSQDIHLIWRYIDSVWEGLTVHCPCCHADYPLSEVENEKLADYRKTKENQQQATLKDHAERRLYLLAQAEKRRKPHLSQLKAITAPERHVVGLGLARGGKSFCLAQVALLYLLQPGANVWLLARIYDDAKKEFEYIETFLYTMFYPVEKYMYTVAFDRKTGEASIRTRWNSILTVKSGKAKGSITGEELDAMLVAEPGWVDGDLFEEVRARMSSRLGRIFALGTPKGTGGFLGRLLKMSRRDMSSGKKLEPGARLIANGCAWGQSLIVYDFDAKDNPEYVLSEIEAARSELTESEFASEFEGRAVAEGNAKFPFVRIEHLRPVAKSECENMVCVLGVDQGERNFAAVLLGWDGRSIFVLNEYFDRSDDTIKSNLAKLNLETPSVLSRLGLPPERWQLTIFDADPPISGQLQELQNEGHKWKTDFTFRPKNHRDFTHWRQETCDWINQLTKEGRLIFGPGCDALHDQIMEALKEPGDSKTEGSSINRKGWVINDPWRGDHCADAWLLACWTISQNQLLVTSRSTKPLDVYEHIEQKFQEDMKTREAEELRGFWRSSRNEEDSELQPSSFCQGSRDHPYDDA